MPTWNKELQGLTLDEINQVSERFLLGWHDPKYDGHNFRIKGLNNKREKYGLKPLTKEWSVEYRIDYIKNHYTYDEIKSTIEQYISENRVADTRWTGIELFGCRFGRDYVKIFRELLGSNVWRKMSELMRVNKLVETQVKEYGGVGVASKATYDKMIDTKIKNVNKELDEFRKGTVINVSNKVFGSIAEETVYYLLIDKFGKSDILYQYGIHPYDARYPYPCDFYIKSLDLFIEMNTHYAHGNHWYDENNHDDQLRVKHLMQYSSKKIQKCIKTWCETDVEKRQKAKESNIKYLVFWDGVHQRDNTRKDGHKYSPRLLDFKQWYYDYDCKYDIFVKDNPGNTY